MCSSFSFLLPIFFSPLSALTQCAGKWWFLLRKLHCPVVEERKPAHVRGAGGGDAGRNTAGEWQRSAAGGRHRAVGAEGASLPGRAVRDCKYGRRTGTGRTGRVGKGRRTVVQVVSRNCWSDGRLTDTPTHKNTHSHVHVIFLEKLVHGCGFMRNTCVFLAIAGLTSCANRWHVVKMPLDVLSVQLLSIARFSRILPFIHYFPKQHIHFYYTAISLLFTLKGISFCTVSYAVTLSSLQKTATQMQTI